MDAQRYLGMQRFRPLAADLLDPPNPDCAPGAPLRFSGHAQAGSPITLGLISPDIPNNFVLDLWHGSAGPDGAWSTSLVLPTNDTSYVQARDGQGNWSQVRIICAGAPPPGSQVSVPPMAPAPPSPQPAPAPAPSQPSPPGSIIPGIPNLYLGGALIAGAVLLVAFLYVRGRRASPVPAAKPPPRPPPKLPKQQQAHVQLEEDVA